MNFNSELILIESKTARDSHLVNTTHEKAEDALSKAKALMHFALYQGNKLASTESVATFYEVLEATVRQVAKRHNDEFVVEGLKVLKGKALKDVRDAMSLSSDTPQAMAWTPLATLRLGMLLRDSEVAKSVRTVLLEEVNNSGKKSERIQELELERDIAQAQAKTMENERILFEQRKRLYEFHGETGLLVVDGRIAIEIEKPVIETIDEQHKVKFKGQTFPQVVEYLKKRYGVRLKNGGTVKKILRSAEKDGLIAHIPHVVLQEYIPEEHLDEVYGLLNKGSRQMLIGE